MKYAIVAVGYNRPDSMKRLLDSLCAAEYPDLTIDLIVSVDRSAIYDQVVSVARCVEWKHGELIIRTFEERQGLRPHILQCGDYTEIYDAVVVLEDDLIVSPNFFEYVCQTVDKYRFDEQIGGISLYKHSFHQGAYRMFEPEANGYDAFLMQCAQSWGQCWTRNMWKGFREWYSSNETQDLGRDDLLPGYIARWDDHSWLKYYMRYLAETDKYFVYPYVSLTSNASAAGQHCFVPNNDYQVSLRRGSLEYRLPSFSEAVKYDIYFERITDNEAILPALNGKKVLDFYGLRKSFGDADYCISVQSLPFKVVMEIGLVYKPIEQNAFTPEPGQGAFVYKLNEPAKIQKHNDTIVTRYDVRAMRWKSLMRLAFSEMLERIRSKVLRK